MTLTLLQSLGFQINWKKSTLIHLSWLSHRFSRFDLSSSRDEVQKFLAVCASALCQPGMAARQLASLLGTRESCCLVFRSVPLHFRALQILVVQTLKDHQLDHEYPIILNSPSRAELSRSITSVHSVNASCQGRTTNGKWSSQELTPHISILELKAAFLALQAFVKDQSHKVVFLKIDKTTAVAYVNNMGGTHSVPLMSLALEMWTCCLQQAILISAQHVPVKENTTADTESCV